MAAFYYLQVFLSGAPQAIFWLLTLLSPCSMAMGIDAVRDSFTYIVHNSFNTFTHTHLQLMYYDIKVNGDQFSLWGTAEGVPVPLGGHILMLALGNV